MLVDLAQGFFLVVFTRGFFAPGLTRGSFTRGPRTKNISYWVSRRGFFTIGFHSGTVNYERASQGERSGFVARDVTELSDPIHDFGANQVLLKGKRVFD